MDSVDACRSADDAPEPAPEATPARRRGRKAGLPATTAIAQELRRRREMLHLSVRAAAARTGVPFSVICEIERGRRVPSLTTYAKLRQGLGLEVPPTVLLPPRVDAGLLLDEHLTALAACVMSRRGGPLADLAAALGISVAAVREGLLRIADRLEAVGFGAIEDSVEVRLVPVSAAAPALAALDTMETSPQLRVEEFEAICAVAHLGLATRTQVEQFLGGRDCELLLRRLVGRGVLERVVRDPDMVGAPVLYRVTAAAIAATGHSSLESLQRYLAEAVAVADEAVPGSVEVLGRPMAQDAGEGRASTAEDVSADC